MKKKLLSKIALSLCLCMSMSALTACNLDWKALLPALSAPAIGTSGNENSGNENSGNENSGNENSGNENSGNENSGNENTGNENSGGVNNDNSSSQPDDDKPLTEDEILAKVGEAYFGCMAYDGAFTVKGTLVNESAYGEEISTEELKQVASVDPIGNKMYQTSSQGRIQKIFQEQGKTYMYEKIPSATIQEKYQRISKPYAESCIRTYTLKNLGLPTMPASFFSVSVTEFNDAMKTIMEEAIDEVPNSTGMAEMKIECTENVDSNVLKVYQKMDLKKNEDGGIQEHSVVQIISMTEKDDKLIEVSAVNEQTLKIMADDGKTITETRSYKQEVSYEMTYQFDQQGYDNFIVTIPAGVETKNVYDKSFNIVINGIERYMVSSSSSGYDTTTVKGAMKGVMWNAKHSLCGWIDNQIVNIVWYKDEDCTQVINVDTLTEEEFCEIDTLYGQATLIEEGYAFLIETNRTVLGNEASEAYKLCFDALYAGGSIGIRVVRAGTAIHFGDSADIVFVNGSTVKEDSFVIESGKTYNIEYRNIFNKEYILKSFFGI